MPLSKKLAILYLKYLAVGYLFVRQWLISLSRILTSLPPWSIIRPFLLANSYTPDSLGTPWTFNSMYFDHLFCIGIISSYMKNTLQECYNISTYKSPPVGTGGLEPPRQLPASSYQDYCVCQLHHVPISENAEGASLPDETPSKNPQLKRYHNLCDLSIDKTTHLYLNTGIKSKLGGAMMAVCPHCYSREMIRHGKYKRKQRWLCLKCKRTTLQPRQRVPKGYEG